MSATKPNYCCPENDIARKDMASEVLPCFICIFVLLAMLSFECEAFVISRPALGKILFLTKNSLPAMSKVNLKTFFTQAIYRL